MWIWIIIRIEIFMKKHDYDHPDIAASLNNLGALYIGIKRFEDAIQLLLSKQKKNQRWSAYRGPGGAVFFNLEQAGKPSKLNTLRALRVLKWWENSI